MELFSVPQAWVGACQILTPCHRQHPWHGHSRNVVPLDLTWPGCCFPFPVSNYQIIQTNLEISKHLLAREQLDDLYRSVSVLFCIINSLKSTHLSKQVISFKTTSTSIPNSQYPITASGCITLPSSSLPCPSFLHSTEIHQAEALHPQAQPPHPQPQQGRESKPS